MKKEGRKEGKEKRNKEKKILAASLALLQGRMKGCIHVSGCL